MKSELLRLSGEELEISAYAESQIGSMDYITTKLNLEGIFDKYRTIHRAYLNLYDTSDDNDTKLETLKRLVFLNWYSQVEPSFYTGIDDLEIDIVYQSYKLLDQYIIKHKLDAELTWMLTYYSSWPETILNYAQNKMQALSQFVVNIDTSVSTVPKRQLSKGVMNGRGQMGVYWLSCFVEVE